jgi:hypothetical protein
MKCLASSIFFFCNSTKMKLWTLPTIEGAILKYRVPPLWPTYIGETRTTFAKAYREQLGELIGNQGKWNQTPPFPHPTPRKTLKG